LEKTFFPLRSDVQPEVPFPVDCGIEGIDNSSNKEDATLNRPTKPEESCFLLTKVPFPANLSVWALRSWLEKKPQLAGNQPAVG
jgi:hypothetical protein